MKLPTGGPIELFVYILLIVALIYVGIICPIFAFFQISIARELRNKWLWLVGIALLGPLVSLPYFTIYGRNQITRYAHATMICLLIVLSVLGFSVRDKIKAMYHEQVQFLEQLKNCPDGECI